MWEAKYVSLESCGQESVRVSENLRFCSVFIYLFLFNVYVFALVGTGIGSSYGLDDRRVGVRVPVRSRILSSPRRPDRLWGSPGSFPGGKATGT
jgi:hypothetical protein